MNIYLIAGAIAGTDIKVVAKEMSVLSKRLKVNIEFEFSGVSMMASPNASAKSLLDYYYEIKFKNSRSKV